jgi:hypothetical protein
MPMPQQDIAPNNSEELVKLLTFAQLIDALDSRAILQEFKSLQQKDLSQALVERGIATKEEMASVLMAQQLIKKSMIKESQFAIAMYDQRCLGIPLLKSLKARGWLPAELELSSD